MNFTYGDSETEEKAYEFSLSGRQCMKAYREFKDLKREESTCTSSKTLKCCENYSSINSQV